MPVYEYRCEICGNEFEELVRGDEVPACPKCGKNQLRRKISTPAAPRNATSGCPARDADRCPDAGSCCCGNCGCHAH
ncbi:MAG: zinc ribbon domain-containing protein [Planctomycetia bacterium]|nr:zinc ribbon domain-containing protein [Planctomycetia bacterium]